jgi:hypothetical protein
MGKFRIADRWEIMRPFTAREGEWSRPPDGESRHSEHWRIYLGALRIDLFSTEDSPHVWLVDVAPFFSREMIGGRLSAEKAKVVALATVQGVLHHHLTLMDGKL